MRFIDPMFFLCAGVRSHEGNALTAFDYSASVFPRRPLSQTDQFVDSYTIKQKEKFALTGNRYEIPPVKLYLSKYYVYFLYRICDHLR